MSIEVINFLGSSVTTSYRSLEYKERRERLTNETLSVTLPKNVPEEENQREVERLRQLGYAPMSLRFLLGAAHEAAQDWQIEMPYPHYRTSEDISGLSRKEKKQVKQAQTIFINVAFSKIDLYREKSTNKVKAVILGERKDKDITDLVEPLIYSTNSIADEMFENEVYLSGAITRLRSFVQQNKGIAVYLDSPLYYPDGPSIVQETERRVNDVKGDMVVASSKEEHRHLQSLREVVRFGQLLSQREGIQKGIDEKRIALLPAFKRDKWPIHPLMMHLKTQILPLIADEVRQAGVQVDEQDIRYQSLFRLATYSVSNIFNYGHYLDDYLVKQGSYANWQRIPDINLAQVEQFQIDKELACQVIREQLAITSDRSAKSVLPIADILTPQGIFAEKGWEIVKVKDRITAINKNLGAQQDLQFKEVDQDVASAFHQDLHYIHTPRVDWAFGLFLDGEELPFSVLGVQRVDRDYKKNVLLAYGYDPDQCVDFTRLYSKPGTPFNTSTAIFGSTFSFLRQNYPQLQAAVSAFMPTYASGLSMVSGGFDQPIIVKEGRQSFEQKRLEGQEVWEFVTNRRKASSEQVQSAIPMLPTIELLCPIKKTRFSPLAGVGGKMFDLT